MASSPSALFQSMWSLLLAVMVGQAVVINSSTMTTPSVASVSSVTSSSAWPARRSPLTIAISTSSRFDVRLCHRLAAICTATSVNVASASEDVATASSHSAPNPSPESSALRHYLQFSDLNGTEYSQILARARQFKSDIKERRPGRSSSWTPQVFLLFEKSSTRTFSSFSVGASMLGANVVDLSLHSQLKRGESIADTVRAVSYADTWVVRTFAQAELAEFAQYASAPVINALTDDHHPCQILADIMTFIEHRGGIEGRTVAWVGDGNNMANSWLQAAAVFGFKLRLATPGGYGVAPEILDRIPSHCYELVETKEDAVQGADLVTTDVWTSMGFEAGEDDRRLTFESFQVDADLMRLAHPEALFMHCLPVHRGEEVTAEVVDGPQSVIWDEAQNRLYVQMAIMEFLMLQANRLDALY